MDFELNVEGKVEHFDVYGEVQTLYSQVGYRIFRIGNK